MFFTYLQFINVAIHFHFGMTICNEQKIAHAAHAIRKGYHLNFKSSTSGCNCLTSYFPEFIQFYAFKNAVKPIGFCCCEYKMQTNENLTTLEQNFWLTQSSLSIIAITVGFSVLNCVNCVFSFGKLFAVLAFSRSELNNVHLCQVNTYRSAIALHTPWQTNAKLEVYCIQLQRANV